MLKTEKTFVLLKLYLTNQDTSYGSFLNVLGDTINSVRRPFDGHDLWRDAKALKAQYTNSQLDPEIKTFLNSLVEYLNLKGTRDGYSVILQGFNKSIENLTWYHLTARLNYSPDVAKTLLFFSPPPSIISSNSK